MPELALSRSFPIEQATRLVEPVSGPGSIVMRTIRTPHTRASPVAFLAAGLLATVGLLASGALADDGPKGPVPAKLQSAYPQPTFASESEKQAFESKGKADWVGRNDAFREAFIASGKDIHALPQTTVRTVRLGDGSLSFVTSSDTGRGVTASWTAAKGETYVIVATSQNPGDTGDYSLTFHDLNNINTRAASHIVNKDEIDRFLELKKR